jgi:NAD(P)H-quinone oxidoreductase subunit 4
MGYIILASAVATPLSLTGTVAQMISHGLISALLFLLVGVVYAKTGTRDVNVLRGLLNPERGLPLIGSLMIVGAMASAGIPGMVGFVAEFIVYRGSLPVFPVPTLLCMLGTGLTAVYFLILINRVFFGRLPEALANLPRVRWQDRLPSVIVTSLVILLGLQPNWMLRWSNVTTNAMGMEEVDRLSRSAFIQPLEALKFHEPPGIAQTSIERKIEPIAQNEESVFRPIAAATLPIEVQSSEPQSFSTSIAHLYSFGRTEP